MTARRRVPSRAESGQKARQAVRHSIRAEKWRSAWSRVWTLYMRRVRFSGMAGLARSASGGEASAGAGSAVRVMAWVARAAFPCGLNEAAGL